MFPENFSFLYRHKHLFTPFCPLWLLLQMPVPPQLLIVMQLFLHSTTTSTWGTAKIPAMHRSCCHLLPSTACMFPSLHIYFFVFEENWYLSQENLIDTKDPVLLIHQPMHNVLFLVRNEYNALTKATPGMVTPLGYQAVTNFCCEVQVVHAASSTTPVPITAQDKALADIAEVMAKVKAKAHSFHTCIFFLLY